MSDHVTVLVFTDDHVCMETMIVLPLRARDHDRPHVLLVTIPMTIPMFMLVIMVNWFCTWTEGRFYFSRCSSTLGPEAIGIAVPAHVLKGIGAVRNKVEMIPWGVKSLDRSTW